MLKAVIFDVDGTLVNSVDHHARAWCEAFSLYGHEVGFSDVRNQIGKGGDQLMPVFLSKAEILRFGAELEKRRSQIFKTRYLPEIKAFPEVRALFQRLINDGKRVVLASSAKGDELEIYKKIARITDLVENETSKDDAEKSKPHPDIFLAALAKLPGVEESEVLVIGDTPYDAEAAAKAHIRMVGVRCGGFSDVKLKAAGCKEIHDDPADLLATYEKWIDGEKVENPMPAQTPTALC